MELQQNVDESAAISNASEQLSWQRERSTDELLGFIARREAVVFDSDDDLFGLAV